MVSASIYEEIEDEGTHELWITTTKFECTPHVGDILMIDMGGFNHISGKVMEIEHQLDKNGSKHYMCIRIEREGDEDVTT